MPKLTATETFRAMLDERGVEWRGADRDARTWFDVDGILWFVFEHSDGDLSANAVFLTPKQAIAATLGPGTCKPTTYDNGYPMDRVEPGEYYEFWEPACACGNCGELIPMRKFCPNCGARCVW